jgi:hypothetical protein
VGHILGSDAVCSLVHASMISILVGHILGSDVSCKLIHCSLPSKDMVNIIGFVLATRIRSHCFMRNAEFCGPLERPLPAQGVSVSCPLGSGEGVVTCYRSTDV